MRRSTICLSLLLAAALGGCASHKATQPTSMGVMGNAPATLSLGAGDSLGRAVYVNDLILAAAALDKTTTFTNVETEEVQQLLDN